MTDRHTTFLLLFYDKQGQSVYRHKNTDVNVGDIDWNDIENNAINQWLSVVD